MDTLLQAPVAFLIYLGFAFIIYFVGKFLAGPPEPSAMKSSVYGSGEEAPSHYAAPGFKPFFLIAFFFAILHLGTLVLGTGGFTMTTAVYIVGLIVALIVLVLG